MFGRRKQGFTREVVIKEFQNEVNEDSIMEGENLLEENKDLMDYLDETEYSVVEERSDSELLVEFIRERSMGSSLTSQSFLYDEDENMEKIIRIMKEDEDNKDIIVIRGNNEIYYYSNKYMSDNYAMIALLVEEKDVCKTIAEMVRWNASTYPCPTPIYYFRNSPYSYTDEEIEITIERIKNKEEYKDIGEIITGNKVRYLYSGLYMSEKYARALAESTELGEYGYI